jgi:hypothetical protein
MRVSALTWGHAVAYLVKALCYKHGGHGAPTKILTLTKGENKHRTRMGFISAVHRAGIVSQTFVKIYKFCEQWEMYWSEIVVNILGKNFSNVLLEHIASFLTIVFWTFQCPNG